MGTQKMQVLHNYKVFPLTKTLSCMVTGMQPKAGEGNHGQGKHLLAGQDNLAEGSLGQDNLGEAAVEGILGQDNLGQGSLAVGSLAGAGEGRQQTSRKVEVEPA